MHTLLQSIIEQTRKKRLSKLGTIHHKIVAKKAISVAKTIAYERLYEKLDTKEGAKEAFQLGMVRERRRRDMYNIRCIKDEDDKVLVEEVKSKEGWQMYFFKLFNGEMNENS